MISSIQPGPERQEDQEHGVVLIDQKGSNQPDRTLGEEVYSRCQLQIRCPKSKFQFGIILYLRNMN